MTEEELLVAVVDQGSSSTKGAVVDEEGRRHDEVTVPIGTISDGASVKHDPNEIAESVERTLDALVERHRVAAIGVTCQRSTCLLWDRTSGTPLTEALSWQDTSQRRRIESLSAHADLIQQTTGLRLSPHYAAPKMAFLLESDRELASLAERGELVAGTLDAFLGRRLTGSDGTEPGHAGRTLLHDLDKNAWSSELAEVFGIPVAALPPLRPSVGSRGTYRGVPVTAMAGDQQAALLGHGGWNQGISAVHFGTGAFVLAATGDRPERHPAALTAVVASTPERIAFQVEATINSAGSAVDWAAQLCRQNLNDWRDVELDPDSLPLVLPAFRGVGAPWWRPEARAAVAGLELGSSPADLFAGTLAGVAMRVLDCLDLLQSITPITALRASGKLTRLRGLIDLLADAGQIPIETAADEEVGLLGIARLALAGVAMSDRALARESLSSSRREPRWSADRARATRARWRSFVEGALGA